MPPPAHLTGWSGWPQPYRCKGRARRWKWRKRCCGCFRPPRLTPPAPSWRLGADGNSRPLLRRLARHLQRARYWLNHFPVDLPPRIMLVNRIAENLAGNLSMSKNSAYHGQRDGTVVLNKKFLHNDAGKIGEFPPCLPQNLLGQFVSCIGSGHNCGEQGRKIW